MSLVIATRRSACVIRTSRRSAIHRVSRSDLHRSKIMSQRQIVLSTPLRTAIGTFGGSLKGTPATSLGAAVVGAVLARARLAPAKVDTVVMGNVVQAGNKMNPARQAAIQGGLPVEVPAMTVNRVCGSGVQAIVSAAQD